MMKKPRVIDGVLKAMGTTPNVTKKRDSATPKKTTTKRSTTKVFAVSLDILMKQQRSQFPELDIPLFVKRSIDFLTAHGLSEKGVFRISANKAALDKAQQQIDEGTLLNIQFF
jgi:hypothetical protein